MEYSVFIDESGDTGTDSEYYLLTLVFHDQDDSIASNIAAYQSRLRAAKLPDIPFHMGPLMSGKNDYDSTPIEDRAKMLSYFHEFAVRCPIVHKTFLYEKKEYGLRDKDPNPDMISKRLGDRMERDIKAAIYDNLEFFQQFERVKVYYDNGQKAVTRAVRNAFGECLAKGTVEFKTGVRYREYRLCQIADMICGFAFLDFKFANGLQNETDEMFADDHKNLRKRFLKKIARLELDRRGLAKRI